MLPAELLRQIRMLEIRTNRAVDELIGGAYHSVFKLGIELGIRAVGMIAVAPWFGIVKTTMWQRTDIFT